MTAAETARTLWKRAAAALAVAALLTALGSTLPASNGLQGWITDLSVAARALVFGERPLGTESVLVVGSDERSLASPELYGRPRSMFSPVYADLIGKALEHGARGVIFDIILAYDAKDLEIGGEYPLKSYDVPFLKLMQREKATGRVVLGWSSGLLPARRFTLVAGDKGLGLVQIPFGPGNVIREVPTRLPDAGGALHETLSGRALALMGHEAPDWVSLRPPAPLTTLPSASMIDLLRCDDPERLRAAVAGRVLFLGGMLPGEDRLKTSDQLISRDDGTPKIIAPDDSSVACDFPAPIARVGGEPHLPGVFIHAAAVDAVIEGWAARPAPHAAALALMFVSATLAAGLAFFLRPAAGAGWLGLLIAGQFALSVAVLELGHDLPVAWAMVGAGIAFLAAYGIRIRMLDRQSALIRQQFGRYLSPILVQNMIASGRMPDLRGEQREVTVMFADLSGFTAASESLESIELMTVLNRYLDAISEIVRQHGGYIDKFIGDAVMAIFNAPGPVVGHALAAVEAGHEMVEAVARLKAEDTARGRVGFSLKVGISTGQATLGNVGSRDRVNYTVVGETVNLAARFESLPGFFRTPIIIGPEVAGHARSRFLMLRIVSIQVKGKSRGVDIWAPLVPVGEETPMLKTSVADYGAALQRYQEGAFETAAELWQALAMRDWPGRGPSAAMAGEALKMMRNPPDGPWTGVMVAAGK